MAKPRVFVSSTYYDLKHIRNSLKGFIENLGYEAVLFESGDIPFLHDVPLDESCYSEIQNCHMLVLIVGGQYGSPSSETRTTASNDQEKAYQFYNSVTKREYETARNRDIPIFIFVGNNVLAEYQTYKENRDNETITYHHVDNVNIYRLLDEILAQRRNNFIRGFEKFDDISTWLRDQWAGLYADFITKKSTERTLTDLSSQIASLEQISNVLKTYTESIMKKIQPEEFETIISNQEKRLRKREIMRFRSEPMIEYLLETGEPKITATGIHKAFEVSRSLEDFLEKCKFDKDYISGFLSASEQGARIDYNELKHRYLMKEFDEVDIPLDG